MSKGNNVLNERFIREAKSKGYDCFSGDYQVLAIGCMQSSEAFEPSIMSRDVMCEEDDACYDYFLVLLRKGEDFYKFAITSCATTMRFAISFRKLSQVKRLDLICIKSIQEWNSKPLYLTIDLAVTLFNTPINTMDGCTDLTEDKLCPTFINPFIGTLGDHYISALHGSAEWILRTFDSCIKQDFKEIYKGVIENQIGKPYQEIAEEAYTMFIKSREESEEE